MKPASYPHSHSYYGYNQRDRSAVEMWITRLGLHPKIEDISNESNQKTFLMSFDKRQKDP